MSDNATAYVAVRREEGFRDVCPLTPGQRYTLGRATTNRIVIKDELCSREHAEIYYADDRWRLRDLKSLNGTRVNDIRAEPPPRAATPAVPEPAADASQLRDTLHKGTIASQHHPVRVESFTLSPPELFALSPGDIIHIGRTILCFVEQLEQLPDPAIGSSDSGGVKIENRLGHTRFLTPIPPGSDSESPYDNRNLNHTLTLLYRLALDMGSAGDIEQLVQVVLDALLEATPADMGAILSVNKDQKLDVLDHRHRDGNAKAYRPVSEYVSNEVLRSREAVLAVDIAADCHLSNRQSIAYIGATSLICAPAMFQDKVLALIHLYCTTTDKCLDAENLQFALAAANHFGAAMHQLNRWMALTAENRFLRDQLGIQSELVGKSGAIKEIESQIARVAGTDATVLIRGETGTGKELVARAIHFSSPRKDGPFISVNCAALTETLLESELFGHEKGAFTGATDRRLGHFEEANHGTIFLDEIGEMNTLTQAKLLRVLEGHPFHRVGGGTAVRVDVRVVSATNQDLCKAVDAGNFRRDLFFRLNVVPILLPALRERRDDIPLLAEHFLKHFVTKHRRHNIRGFTPAALKKMQDYHWPGNVRELRNYIVERAVVMLLGPMIDAPDISPWLSSPEPPSPLPMPQQLPPPPQSWPEAEKQCITQALEHTAWNRARAAKILDMAPATLKRKINFYGLKPPEKP